MPRRSVPYRGAGRPEGNYFMESLIDTAAAEMEIDRLALRRRNLISSRDLPYKTASDMTYDSGDFAALTKKAFELADGKGFDRRKRESRKRGKLARFLASATFWKSPRRRRKSGRNRLQRRRHRDARDRHARLRHGPRYALRASAGASSSAFRLRRSSSCKATAIACRLAAAAAARNCSCTAVPRSSKPQRKSSKRARTSPATCSKQHPPILSSVTAALSSPAPTARFRSWSSRKPCATAPPSCRRTRHNRSTSRISATVPRSLTLPNGCHVAEVEVDPETGVVEVVKYTCVDDFGVVC